MKPSDLTADHVYDHTDGDIFWWITNGIGDVMPPLGVALDEDARWNVIDFVRANADAARLGRAAGKVTNVGYRAPDFSAVCPDGSIVARDDLRGRTAHLVISGPHRSGTRQAIAAARQPRCRRGCDPARRRRDRKRLPRRRQRACRGARDASPARMRGHSDGTEFLVDASGSLRAIWSPGDKPDWRDADALQRETAAIRDAPPAMRTHGVARPRALTPS